MAMIRRWKTYAGIYGYDGGTNREVPTYLIHRLLESESERFYCTVWSNFAYEKSPFLL